MLKHVTIALSAALLSACTITSDDSASDGNTNTATNTNGTTGTTTTAPTTANPTTGTTGETTTGTTGEATGTTGETPTTGVTTTAATMTTSGTTGDTGDTTDTGGGLYGLCGWQVIDKSGVYACADMGGIPGAEDPDMQYPIACPEGLMEGAKCDNDKGPVFSTGCCTPEGVNYFCDVEGKMKVFRDDCAS